MKSRLAYNFIVLFLTLSFFILVSGCERSKSREKELWEHWKLSNELEQARVEHYVWNDLLQKYVELSPNYNRVKYASISSEDKIKLKIYIDYLSELGVTRLARKEQLAYWINLYNAEVWEIILNYYPVKSIQKINISPGNFSKGPWGKKFTYIEGVPISLNDIEDRILRPIWGDDRIHYLLNKAAIGSPNIQNVAITTENVEELLEESRSAFINSTRAVQVKGKSISLSKIYKDYLFDFAEDEKSLLSYILKYYSGDKSSIIQNFDPSTQKIKYQFDWKLNE